MSVERNPSTFSGMHRKSVAEEPVTSVLAPGEVPILDRDLSADEEVLAALGYKYATCYFSRTIRNILIHFKGPSSNVNSRYGRLFASPSPFLACYHRSPQLSGMVWAMQVLLVWSGDG